MARRSRYVERRENGDLVIHALDLPYLFRFVKLPPDRHGDCDPPHKPNRTIRVDSRLTGRTRLRNIIHETLHAGDWYKDEEWIREMANLLGDLLWEIGYRGDPKAAIKLITIEE
jgi:hypothetical protein